MSNIDKIGRLQVELLLEVGEVLNQDSMKGSNAGSNTLHNKLGLSKKETTKARTLYQFKDKVKDCVSVVSALQICSAERDNMRNNRKPTTVKALTPEQLEAKNLKDAKENDEDNAHRAMRAL